MKDKILKFVEEQVNPTIGEIINHVQADIRKNIEALEKTGELFKYWDQASGFNGEYRVCNDKGLI